MRGLLFLVVLLSPAGIATGHSPTPADHPKAMIEQLLQIAIDGNMLTPEGWNKTGVLFMHPSPQPHDKPITVIGNDYSVREIWTRGNQAELSVTYRDLGRIDSSLRYSPPDARFPRIVVRYRLILKGEPAPAGRGTGKMGGPREWRIANAQSSLWTGLNAAIRYVTEMSQKASDPVIKKNGAQTLVTLMKIKE